MTEKKKRTKKPEFDDFRLWLTNIGMQNPVLHVNGIAHGTAVLTVDFGTPLVEQKLDSDQNAELVNRMRMATKSLYHDKDVNVRVQNDTFYGVWWTSVG